jgi:hypothetical protein
VVTCRSDVVHAASPADPLAADPDGDVAVAGDVAAAEEAAADDAEEAGAAVEEEPPAAAEVAEEPDPAVEHPATATTAAPAATALIS